MCCGRRRCEPWRRTASKPTPPDALVLASIKEPRWRSYVYGYYRLRRTTRFATRPTGGGAGAGGDEHADDRDGGSTFQHAAAGHGARHRDVPAVDAPGRW